MLTIPTDMASWHPADVTAWRSGLDDDPTVTDDDLARADRAVTAALLGDDLADEIHGPAPQSASVPAEDDRARRTATASVLGHAPTSTTTAYSTDRP